MTRLLLLSVQRIFKNLNKICREVLHLGKRASHTIDQGIQAGGRDLQKGKEYCKKNGHSLEIKLTEQV